MHSTANTIEGCIYVSWWLLWNDSPKNCNVHGLLRSYSAQTRSIKIASRVTINMEEPPLSGCKVKTIWGTYNLDEHDRPLEVMSASKKLEAWGGKSNKMSTHTPAKESSITNEATNNGNLQNYQGLCEYTLSESLSTKWYYRQRRHTCDNGSVGTS